MQEKQKALPAVMGRLHIIQLSDDNDLRHFGCKKIKYVNVVVKIQRMKL